MSYQNAELHVAIIMDGNGRWAKNRGLPRVLGHQEGVKTIKKIITHAVKKNIKVFSAFAFSAENWLRPKEEISFLMDLLEKYISSERDTILNNNIKLVLSGRLDRLPDNTRNALLKLKEDSQNNNGMILNLAVSYSGQEEIVDCMKSILKKIDKREISKDILDEKIIRNNLYNPELPDVDLLIRTSGEQRISNFMLWQIAYAELYFTDKHWPDFNEEDFDLALLEYNKRIRRFGKTDEQIHEEGK